jgi:hypothetical protein
VVLTPVSFFIVNGWYTFLNTSLRQLRLARNWAEEESGTQPQKSSVEQACASGEPSFPTQGRSATWYQAAALVTAHSERERPTRQPNGLGGL